MLRFLSISILFFLLSESFFAQDVNTVYDVKAGSTTNEYAIKTTISGLIGVDIARIKFLINNEHTYKPSPNNQLFSDRNENYIKFYIMAIPASGIINIELGVILAGSGEYAFPVELQYSRNEEKKVINLPKITIKGNGMLAATEAPEPLPTIVNEEPVEVVSEPTLPVVKEEPVVEVAKPVKPLVKEEPIIEDSQPAPAIVKEEPVMKPAPPVIKEVPVEVVSKPAPPVIKDEPIVEVTQPTPPIVKEQPATSTTKGSTKYTVQLLSLLEFSQARLTSYCKQHHIPLDKVKKNKKGEWMKITYGEANSREEAYQLLEKLKQDHQVKEAFIVTTN